MSKTSVAKFKIGQVVRHRRFAFRGVVFDIDPEFSNTNEWYEAIPAEARPRKDQPFYHVFAENNSLGVGDTPEEAVEDGQKALFACLDALKAVDRAPPAPSASTS